MKTTTNKPHFLMVRSLVSLGLVLSLLWQGQAWAVQNAASYTTATRYNLAGQVTGVIRPANVYTGGTNYPATRNTYSSSTGLLTRVETGALSSWKNETVNPSSWSGFSVQSRVEYTYDSRGRKRTEKHVSGSKATLTQYSYDQYDRLTCKAVRMNPSRYNSLPSSACALGVQGVYGPDRITKYTYQQPTNTTTNITANFDLITHERRAVGTNLEQVYRKNDYDSLGRLSYVTDANGNKARMTYDARSRLSRWYFPNKTNTGFASTTDYEQYNYDNNSNRTSLRKRDGRIIRYTYDQLNRVIKKDIPNSTSLDVYYDYDLRGLELHARFGSDSGAGITRTFDGHGRPLTESNNTSGTTRALSYLHDNNSNRTRLTYPDNKYVVYGYDGLNRLGLTSLPSSSGSVLLRFDNYARPKAIERANNADTNLRYDALSRLNQLSDDMASSGYDNTFDYDYNPANQLIQQDISNGRYHYDIKNQTGLNHNYSVNGLNQYINVAGKSHSYDANGNLTNDGNTIYTYDVENRLIRARGAKVADLTYDPVGRLSKIVAGGQTTYFMYDGNALVVEYTGSTMSKRYVHSVEVDHPIAEYTGSGTTTSNVSYLHRNHQGSIIAASKGNGRGDYLKNYDAFGKMSGDTQGRFAYTGQIWLPEIGLYHYKARAYNPNIGRFMQSDPVGYEDQMNLYAYVGNDPMNTRDPSGEVGVFGAIVGGGLDYALQVGANLASGQDLGNALTNVNLISIGASAALGAVGQVGGTNVAKSFVSGLSNKAKGNLGEAVARAGIAVRGEKVQVAQKAAGTINTLNVSGRAAKAVPDFVVTTKSGATKIVEAKFNTAGLTGAQRALKKQTGDAFTVSRTTLDDVGNAAGKVTGALGGAAGAVTTQNSCSISNVCE